MNYSTHQKICIAQVVRIARLRGFPVSEDDKKYQMMGLTWSSELRIIPESQLKATIDEAWRYHRPDEPFSTSAILDTWRQLSTQQIPESVSRLSIIAQCVHDWVFVKEELSNILFAGGWECSKCGKYRPHIQRTQQTATRDAFEKASGLLTMALEGGSI